MKIIIVGAGVAGLAIGWRLAEAGASVEIFDRGLAGRGAIWASAGMLAPGAELGPQASPLARLAHESRGAWPRFAADLQEASGVPVGFREDGSLIVAWDEADAQRMRAQAAQLAKHGIAAEWLTASEVLKREKLLTPHLAGALFVAEDAQVDNRALSEALRTALLKRGGVLRENCAVETVIVEHGDARGIATADGVVRGEKILLATGAWLNRIAGIPPGVLPEVKPIKGQMAAISPPPATALPRALIRDDEAYLVPRRDHLLIGATVEDAGFDMSVTRAAHHALLRAATRLIPDLTSWPLLEAWAGLRPRATDESPVLGETGIGGLYVAGGQYRNGVLFAPLVADIVCNVLLGRRADGDAFDPKRFRAAS
jgi:glycine oxidase